MEKNQPSFDKHEMFWLRCETVGFKIDQLVADVNCVFMKQIIN